MREPENIPDEVPTNSVSLYVESGKDQRSKDLLRQAGFADGSKGPNLLTVLSFGRQVGLDKTTGYGIQLTYDDIVNLSQAYIDGFYSAAGFGQNLVLAIGIPCGGYAGSTPAEKEEDAWNKGAAWADLVSRLYQSAIASHPGVEVVGANDFESGHRYCQNRELGGVRAARAWAAGFDAAATDRVLSTGLPIFYVNFGSADGCPTGDPSQASVNPRYCFVDAPANEPDQLTTATAWNEDDYWSLSTGPHSGLGIPNIYGHSNDEQWTSIAVYGQKRYGRNQDTFLDFVSSLTQKGACDQGGGASACGGPSSEPDSTYNAPDEGWDMLWGTLDRFDETRQTVGYSSDIKHQS